MSDFPDTPDGEVVDVSGRTVMPGLIDCHVHLSIDGDADPIGQIVADTAAMSALRMAGNAAKTLAAGVTTVRDLGAKDHVDISFRRALDEGLATAAPRLVLSGQPVTMTGGHCWQFGRQADGVDDARRAAREQIRAGADCVKLMATGGILTQGNEIGAAQLEEAEMRAAIEEADKAGKLTAVHAHGASGIKNGVRAGVHSVEHAYFLDDEGIDLMLKRRRVAGAHRGRGRPGGEERDRIRDSGRRGGKGGTGHREPARDMQERAGVGCQDRDGHGCRHAL